MDRIIILEVIGLDFSGPRFIIMLSPLNKELENLSEFNEDINLT